MNIEQWNIISFGTLFSCEPTSHPFMQSTHYYAFKQCLSEIHSNNGQNSLSRICLLLCDCAFPLSKEWIAILILIIWTCAVLACSGHYTAMEMQCANWKPMFQDSLCSTTCLLLSGAATLKTCWLGYWCEKEDSRNRISPQLCE